MSLQTSYSGHSYQPIEPNLSSVSVLSRNDSNDGDDDGTAGGKKKKSGKRRKVNHACIFCRRSHMTCDEGRPCQRCIKREIGHLCHDERKPLQAGNAAITGDKQSPPSGVSMSPSDPSRNFQQNFGMGANSSTVMPWNMNMNNLGMSSEQITNEFSFLSELLENLDEASFFNGPQNQAPIGTPMSGYPVQPIPQETQPNYREQQAQSVYDSNNSVTAFPNQQRAEPQTEPPAPAPPSNPKSPMPKSKESAPPILLSASKKERFLIIAADQENGPRDARLKRVIQAKYEAGLLKPYDYVKGYARLSRWMDRSVSQDSKQQILQPLSILRPKFRAVAQGLNDMDLIIIEESFERLLLDYDRVFSAMGVPACLWRRTGEIYKGNREFAELVGVDEYMLRDGRLCIYEIMAEESAVNYWEKYGQAAFDSSQKAVLTSCVLRFRPVIHSRSSGYSTPVSHRRANANTKSEKGEEGFVNCCFSFTINRDKAGIPIMIVGNFIKC